jgi:hypothetical protein
MRLDVNRGPGPLHTPPNGVCRDPVIESNLPGGFDERENGHPATAGQVKPSWPRPKGYKLSLEELLDADVQVYWLRTVARAYREAGDRLIVEGTVPVWEAPYMRRMGARLARRKACPAPLTAEQLLDALIDRAVIS